MTARPDTVLVAGSELIIRQRKLIVGSNPTGSSSHSYNPLVVGSSPTRPTSYSLLAQLVEQSTVNAWVECSSHSEGAILLTIKGYNYEESF